MQNGKSASSCVSGANSAPGWMLVVALHLIPGVLIAAVYYALARYAAGADVPVYMALMYTIALCLVPVELGVLWLWRLKNSRSGAGEAVVAYRHKGSVSDYTVLPVLLFALFAIISLAVYPLQQLLEAKLASLVPAYARTENLLDGLATASAGQRNAALTAGLILSGLAAPLVEETYFRGFLLPRMKAAGCLAPVLSALLFAVYHFFAPWNAPVIFVAFIPVVFVVWLKKDFLIGAVAHCMINIWGVVQVFIISR